jgi:glycosyltransferase involved in cell wall biosynthesis
VLSEQPEARLWLLGEGEDRDVLTALANGLGIHPRVCLPGTLDDVRDALRAADIVVRPAHDSGTAAGLAEAMAAGSPIVATDLPGHRARIDHEVHGLVVPPSDPAALAKAICRLLADRPLATTLGLAAQGRAARHFSFEAMVSGHLELFGRLLERQKKG